MPKKLTAKTAHAQLLPSVGKVRQRGRPAMLSRQAIIDRTLELLEIRDADEVPMADVALALGVASMSLYKYFPNREALLSAVADYAFSFLALPEASKNWRTYLLGWLWAVQHHADRYPVVRKVMGWEGRVPNAWLRVCAPVLELLQRQGLDGEDLVFAHNWFLSSATGLMMVEAIAPAYRGSLSISQLEGLPPDTQRIYLSIMPLLAGVDREAILEFGFTELIAGVERMLRSVKKNADERR